MSQGDALWDWALAAYARPGLEPLLLELQDRDGHCIGYLLWVAWMASTGRPAPAAVLAEGARIARDWENGVTDPMRQVRRRLRGGPHGALRDQVKAAELDAERALLAMLEPLARPGGRPEGLGAALARGARAWDPRAAPGGLAPLARLLG